jgi:predicted O-methyltransferase YrrM
MTGWGGLLSTRRVLVHLGLFAAAAWLASAALYWWAVGASGADIVPGLAVAPRLLAQASRALVAPDAPFAGLGDSPAVAQLRLSFGEGVRPADGRLLHDMVVSRRFRRVLDVGTARGYAAIWLGLAARATGGRVVTIEIDPQAAAEARENIRRAGLAGVVESRVNDALVEIPSLPGEFDFVFVDPGVPINERVLRLVYDRVPAGGLVVAHNAFGLRLSEPGFRRAIRDDPRLETTIVPTLSGGLSITRRSETARPADEAPPRAE